jgi:hypothetical protein
MRVQEQNVSKMPVSETSVQTSVRTLDEGKIRTGAGCRIQALMVPAKRTADQGRIRMGAGCRIRSLDVAKLRVRQI